MLRRYHLVPDTQFSPIGDFAINATQAEQNAVKELLEALKAERKDINAKSLPVDREVWLRLNKAAREARKLFGLEEETL